MDFYICGGLGTNPCGYQGTTILPKLSLWDPNTKTKDITRKKEKKTQTYRSISLMNIDTKILNKILANQIQQCIGLLWWFSGKESVCQCRGHRFNPCSRKIPPHATEQLTLSLCLSLLILETITTTTGHCCCSFGKYNSIGEFQTAFLLLNYLLETLNS